MAYSLVTPTYSLAIGCIKIGKQSVLKVDLLPDQSIEGDAVATNPGQARMMAVGGTFLVKGPDGSLVLCKFDSERSTTANPVVVKIKG